MSAPAPAVASPGRRALVWALKLAVLAAVLAFAWSRLELDDRVVVRDPGPPPITEVEPGLRSLLAALDPQPLALALLLAGPGLFLLTVRWHLLLTAARTGVPFREVVRLTYVGTFFNTFVPGGVGGDLVRGYGVARHSPRPAEAVAMVLLDRVVGLIGLTLMAAVAVLLRFDTLGRLAQWIGAFLVLAALGIAAYLTPAVRRLLRFDRLLARLPAAIQRVDAALVLVLKRPRSLALAIATTIVIQAVVIAAIAFASRAALGVVRAGYADFIVLLPIGYLVNALPLSPGGLGLMEAALQQLFAEAALATPTQGFMVGLLARFVNVCWSLPGLLFWLLGTRPPPPSTSA